DLLDIEFPILAFSHCRDVVAAVSKAGGLGVLGAGAFSPEQLDVELSWIEKGGGGRPYGVDVLVPAEYAALEEGGLPGKDPATMLPDEPRQFVNELLDRYGVPPFPDSESLPRNSGLLSWSHKGAQPLMDVTFAHKTKLIANALGPAPEYMV